jgi:hypothetical protein
MKAALHAIGRSAEIRPLLALGARLHEVESLAEARAVAGELDKESVLMLFSDEFAEAETVVSAALVLVLPGIRPSSRDPLEMTRELVSRSVGGTSLQIERMVRRMAEAVGEVIKVSDPGGGAQPGRGPHTVVRVGAEALRK